MPVGAGASASSRRSRFWRLRGVLHQQLQQHQLQTLSTVADVAVATGSKDVPVATGLDTVAVGAAEEVGSAEVATMTELLPPTHSNIGRAVHG